MYFLFIISVLFYCTSAEPNCTKLIRELANKQEKFIYCSTTKALPVHLCIGCKSEYDFIYDFFSTFEANCAKEYFNKDRLNLVQSIQNSLIELWTKAYCDDCFRNTTEDSSIFDVFQRKYSDFQNCIFKNKNNECQNCSMQYQTLNSFYTKLDQHNDGKVCFDMQDEMNRTRILWSKQLNCCQRIVDRTMFVVTSSLVSCLPILFYVGMYIITKRRERNHEVLQLGAETQGSEVASFISQQPNITAAT